MRRAFFGLSYAAAAVALAGAGMASPGPEMLPVEEAPQPSKTKRSRHTAAPQTVITTYEPKTPTPPLDFERLRAAELKRARKAARPR